jgi:hypothetical protein
MWQDFIFMAGSGLSVFFLAPTVRDANARVPLATSFPSMVIGLVYAATFYTLGMTFSALGAAAAGSMWSLIVMFRSPMPSVSDVTDERPRVEALHLLVADCRCWLRAITGPDEEWLNKFDAEPSHAHAAFAPADD